MKILKSKVILVICVIVLLPVGWIAVVKLEGKKPSILIEKPSPYIGTTQSLSVTVSDPQSGIRKVWIGLVKDGKETVLLNKSLPSAGIIRGSMESTTRLCATAFPSGNGHDLKP